MDGFLWKVQVAITVECKYNFRLQDKHGVNQVDVFCLVIRNCKECDWKFNLRLNNKSDYSTNELDLLEIEWV